MKRSLKSTIDEGRALFGRYVRRPDRDPILRALLKRRSRWLPSLSQLRQLPRVMTRGERIACAVATTVGVIALSTLAIQWYVHVATVVPANGGTYIEGVVGSPHHINPVLALPGSPDDDMVRLVFSGLTRYDGEKATFVPDLAESLQASPDGKVYTVKLRSDLKWHDGQPLVADDVLATVRAIADPANASPLYVSFRGVEVESLDDQTVRFRLPESFAGFPAALSVGLIPSHLWEDIAPAQFPLAEMNIRPIGLGPFRAAEFVREKRGGVKSYTFEAFRDTAARTPYLDRITFKFYDDTTLALDALKNGSLDGLAHLPPESYATVAASHQLAAIPLSQLTALFIRPGEGSVLADRTLRRALAASLDRETLLAGVKEKLQINGGTFRPTFGVLLDLAGSPPEVPRGNADRGREFLVAAGWRSLTRSEAQASVDRPRPPGFASALKVSLERHKDITRFWIKDNRVLELRLVTVDDPLFANLAQGLRDTWELLGIPTTIETLSAKDLRNEVITPRNYELILYAIRYGADGDPYAFWHSTQVQAPGLALTSLADRRVDALLEEARRLMNRDTRRSKLAEVAEIITREVVAIPLFSPSYLWPHGRDLKGINLRRMTLPADRFANVHEWYIKTRRTIFGNK